MYRINRKFKQGLLFLIISSVMMTFTMFMIKNVKSIQDSVLFSYSRNAREINVMFQPSVNIDMGETAEELKKILDDTDSNLFTFPDKSVGIYINDNSFITKHDERELLNQLAENQIMVLQGAIMDIYAQDLIYNHAGIKSSNLNFEAPQLTFSADFIFAIDSVEYVYNFFDSPYFNGYFIVDSKNNPNVPYEVASFFNQQGYKAYVLEGSLNYEGDIWETLVSSYMSNIVFMIIPLLFLIYIMNTFIVADYIMKEENAGVEIRGYYGATMIEQFLNLIKSISPPLVISSLICAGGLFYFDNSIYDVLLILAGNLIYIVVVFFLTFVYQYLRLKVKREVT